MEETWIDRLELNAFLDRFAGYISAMLPDYNSNQKNCTNIIFNDNSYVYVNLTVNTVLKKVACIFNVNLDSMRQDYGEFLNRTSVPLPFTRDSMYIPFKLRKVIKEQDGSNGFINFYQMGGIIEEIIESNNPQLYILINKTKRLELLQELDSARDKLPLAVAAAQLYCYKNSLNSDGREIKKIKEMTFPGKKFQNSQFPKLY